jgi:hypothetical protein
MILDPRQLHPKKGQPVLAWWRRVVGWAASLPVVEQRLGITPRQSRQAFQHLRVMQDEALRWFDSKRQAA